MYYTVLYCSILYYIVLYCTLLYYIAGGKDADRVVRAEVLAWIDGEQEWVEKGKLQMARYWHGATTIQMDSEMMEFCD